MYRILAPSIMIGLITVIFTYVFANVAYFTQLTPAEMIRSSAVAFVSFLVVFVVLVLCYVQQN